MQVDGRPVNIGDEQTLVSVYALLHVNTAWRKARLRSWGSPLRELHVSRLDIGSAVSIRFPEMPEGCVSIACCFNARKGSERASKVALPR